MSDNHFCENCKCFVSPIKMKNLLGYEEIYCPLCLKNNLYISEIPEYEVVFQSDEDQGFQIPTLDDFIRYYKSGEYHRAIGVAGNATTDEIREAINLFEFEHLDSSSKWTIPLQEIKEKLLQADKKKELNEEEFEGESPKINDYNFRAVSLLQQAYSIYKKRNYEESLLIIDQAIEIAPIPEGYMIKGDIYRRLGEIKKGVHNFDLALENYQKAMEMAPKDSSHYIGMALTYVDMGGNENLKKAAEMYQKAIEIEPSSVVLYLDIMELELCTGEYIDVLGTLGECYSLLDPSDKVIASSMACIAMLLEGRPYGEHVNHLLRKEIEITSGWSTYPIDNYLKKLQDEGYHPERVKKALEIQELFKEHMECSVV